MAEPSFSRNSIDVPALAWLDTFLDWLQHNARCVLLAGVAFQVVVLLTMIALPARTLVTGQTILLRVVPIDPRDLFRGDHVNLGYEFSTIPPDAIPGLTYDDQESRPVYVSLEPEEDGRHWRATNYSLQRPQGVVFIKGHAVRWRRLEFGIESYFVQEGEGRKYEQAFHDRKLSAEVALDADGKAVLKGLVIE